MQQLKTDTHLYGCLLKYFMRKIFFAAITSLVALTSCKEDETLYYNNVTMGNIDGECIVSDQGNTFEITEALVNADLSKFEYGRVILSCDILRKTDDKRYSIRLTNIASVLTKPVVYADSIEPDADSLNVDNPIIVHELWYGGGYINMLLQFAVKHGSNTRHLINLIYNGIETDQEGASSYSFTLRHNAYGDLPTENDVEEYSSSFGYVSFPISEMIKTDEAKVTLNWHSHKFENGIYHMLESEHSSRTSDWKKNAFVHQQKQ